MSKPEPYLPPGFRFHPTDEELILHYLRNRAASTPCPVSIIAEVDIYKFDPWELPAKAAFGEKEWYFFSPRDRKYPNGDRPNRTAASGYWKATGTDKLIKATGRTENIGVKKALVFYKGRPPKGLKTNWIMHEYRIVEANNNKRKSNDRSMRLDDWVLCRIYMKCHSLPTIRTTDGEQEDPIQNTAISTFPNIPHQGTLEYHQPSSSIPLSPANFPFLTSFLFDDPSESTLSEFGQVFTNGTINNSYIFPKLSEQEPFVLEMEDQLKDLQSTVWIFGDGV